MAAADRGEVLERLLSMSEAAVALGLGKTSTWEEALSGRLPTVKVGPQGRRRMVRPPDLEAYIAARVEGAPAATPTLPRARRGRRVRR